MRPSFAFLAGAAALALAEPKDKSSASKGTEFNGVAVPPLLELTPANFAEELKKSKHLVVKHYRYQIPRLVSRVRPSLTRVTVRTALTASTSPRRIRPSTSFTTPLIPKISPMPTFPSTTISSSVPSTASPTTICASRMASRHTPLPRFSKMASPLTPYMAGSP